MSKKRALVTGISGMDGSHLADFLLEKGYEVFGVERRASTKNIRNTYKNEKHNFSRNTSFLILARRKPSPRWTDHCSTLRQPPP